MKILSQVMTLSKVLLDYKYGLVGRNLVNILTLAALYSAIAVLFRNPKSYCVVSGPAISIESIGVRY